VGDGGESVDATTKRSCRDQLAFQCLLVLIWDSAKARHSFDHASVFVRGLL